MRPLLALNPQWWTFLHLVGVFGFLTTHGVSIAFALRLRKERDRDRIRQLLTLSGGTITAMYISLVGLIAGGLAAALVNDGFWWKQAWTKISLGILLASIAAMGAIARPYYKGIKEACTLRASGAPRVSDEDLAGRLTGWQPWAIFVIGFGSLLVILYMMVFKRPV